MKYFTRASRSLCLIFLVAALIFPAGLNTRVMANNTVTIDEHAVITDHQTVIAVDEAEDYPVAGIQFIKWI